MTRDDTDSAAQRWARLRFAIIGPLLASPPERGELQTELRRLAAQSYRHPTTSEAVRFGVSTIERWYYAAKNELADPVGVLRRRVRKDAGTQPSLSQPLRVAVRSQYGEHPGWSVQLHYDNLVALAEEKQLGQVPSYATVRRYMRRSDLRRRRKRREQTPGQQAAARRLEQREVRSYEVTHVHGLWHADFHEGSRRVLLPTGSRAEVQLFGALDDKSRLCCHLQWYLAETAECFVHGLSQAFAKRGLPRALMTDNGSAMTAAETRSGLEALSVLHAATLPASPDQNGKQESFWTRIEERLMPMLEGVRELDLALLNEATQAWMELDYNRHPHDELDNETPLSVYLASADVGRDCPSSETLRDVFRQAAFRHQRKSDGTVSICGQRFEVPSSFRTVRRLKVHYARWDLSHIDIVEPRTDKVLAPLYPLDKAQNADGRRRTLEPLPDARVEPQSSDGTIAPLLRKLMRDYAATGLPPAYIPKHDGACDGDVDDEEPSP